MGVIAQNSVILSPISVQQHFADLQHLVYRKLSNAFAMWVWQHVPATKD